MRILSIIILASVLACGGADGGGKVEQAVAIAKEIRAKPDEAEKILGQHNMTPEQWDALMYEIAEDPALAEKYEASFRK